MTPKAEVTVQKKLTVEQTLANRERTHGSFRRHAQIAQELKSLAHFESARLTHTEAEALDMILHKIARVLAGDPHFADHWHDIAGYAMLIDNELSDASATRPPSSSLTERDQQ
jgi:hypothetical protein